MNPLFNCPIGKVKALRHTAALLLSCSCMAFAVQSAPASQATVPAAPAPQASTLPVPAATTTHSSTTGAFKVAVLPFTGEEIGEGMLSSVTKEFQSDLESTHSYDVVKRRKLNKFLASRDPDAGPCQTTACYQDVAKEFGVQGVFVGVVSKGSETWRVQVKQIDVSNGQVTFNHLVEVFGSNDGSLSPNCEELAKVAGGLKIPESDYTVIDRSGRTVWPWVTGGILVAGGATAAAVLLMNQDGGSPATPKTPSSAPDQMIVKW